MANPATVVSFDQASSQQQQANQPGWYQRNKSWAVPTGTFVGGVAVGVAAVKTYDWLYAEDEGDAPAAPAPKGKSA